MSTTTAPTEGATKKKRARPKTQRIRVDFKHKLESALLVQKSPILELFMTTCGTDLSAPLNDVLRRLDYAEDHPIWRLSKTQLRAISNLSRIFNIVGTEEEPLRVVFDGRLRENSEEKTVYIDNLPPSCSMEQLKRRASVFGNVVHVHFPQVDRLKRRCCPGVQTPLNSGFAFVQFTSKVAVRRFCKRYTANTHLNRAHHPKSHKKRKVQAANAQNTTAQSLEAPLAAPAKPDGVPGRVAAHSSSSIEKRKRRSTEMSMSGVEDSGTESDFPRPKIPKAINGEADEGDVKPKTKRRRQKLVVSTFSLTKFLAKIQVFSFNKYRALRQEYLDLKKENFAAVKQAVRQQQHPTDELAAIDEHEANDRTANGEPPARRRKHRRKTTAGDAQKSKPQRSRAKIVGKVFEQKDANFALPVGQKEDHNFDY
ncbi:RRM domain-containing protein [Aphelenchoides fujianensis]|nr:RRM domain-containing protein [Aphelenchoides fujianensis]